jgi:hypothetical protein
LTNDLIYADVLRKRGVSTYLLITRLSSQYKGRQKLLRNLPGIILRTYEFDGRFGVVAGTGGFDPHTE